MTIVDRIRARWEKYRTARAAASVRESMAAVGYDLSNYSDEDIAEGCQKLAAVAKNAGCTAGTLKGLLGHRTDRGNGSVSEWQPIETAPESEMVLCYCPKAHRGVGSCEVLMVFHGGDLGHESGRAYWTNGGPNAGDDMNFAPDEEPTHWMPLPDPPVDAPKT